MLVKIVVIGIALSLAAIVVFCVASDIIGGLEYLKAPKLEGKITESRGEEEVYGYGRNNRIKYGKYLVRINSMYGHEWQEVLIKNKKLKAGDRVELRYKVEAGKVVLLDDSQLRRVVELFVAFIIVIGLLAVFVVFKSLGYE